MPVRIQRLRDTAQFSAAAGILAEAFMTDPLFIHHFPDENRRRIMLRDVYFDAFVKELAPSDTIFIARKYQDSLTEGRVVGVAVWRGPGRRYAIGTRSFLRITAWLLWLFPWRAARALRAFHAIQARTALDPHWYLPFVGVETGERSGRIGERLLRPVHTVARRSRMTCRLTTAVQGTITFYERFGYRASQPFRPLAGMPLMWKMDRPS